MAASPARFLLPLLLCSGAAAQAPAPVRHVPAAQVELEDAFWAPRIAAWRERGLPALLDALERDGYLESFDRVAAKKTGGHRGGPEADARVYEAIQAAAGALALRPDPALSARIRGWIARIAAASERGGGYLATFVTLERPGTRFEDLRDQRELYCLGRLIEAALAWDAVEDDALLAVALAAAGVADEALLEPGAFDPPGLPGVEVALARLAAHAGDDRWLWIADDLILRRGNAEGRRLFGPEVQDLIPAQKLFRASGDARSYLGLERGMVEVYAGSGDGAMLAAVLNGWKHLLEAQAHPHGGVGREPGGDLPDPPRRVARLARAEPATSVDLVLLARRLLDVTRQPAFADHEERVLYNALSAAIGLDGASYLEACPLEARGGLERVAWPDDPRGVTALARFLPEVAGGLYAQDDDDLYVAHFLESEARVELAGVAVRVRQRTRYPAHGTVELTFQPERPARFTVHLRVPAWAGDRVRAGLAGTVSDLRIDRGDQLGLWLSYDRQWTGEEVLVLELPMEPRVVPGGSEEPERVHLARGPLLFALEGVDHERPPGTLALPEELEVVDALAPSLGEGTPALHVRRPPEADVPGQALLTAVPYGLIANRGTTPLSTWIWRSAADAPAEGVVVEHVGGRRVRASHLFRLDSLAALFDGAVPPRAGDATTPRASFLPRRGSTEWIEVDLGRSETVVGLRAVWAEDGEAAEGGASPPAELRVLRLSGEAWHPCGPPGGGALPAPKAGAWEVPLDPFVAGALRLELDLAPGRSAALYELEVLTR